MSEGRPRSGRLWAITTLALASLALQIPFLLRGISHLDEGLVLAIADSLHHGERLYLDRLTPFAPLLFEMLARIFDVFGASLLAARCLQALVFTGCILLIHSILARIVGPRWAFVGAVAAFAIKPLAFPFWTIVNYSQLAMLLCLACVRLTLAFVSDQRMIWLLAAGVAAGTAGMTKQNLGLYVCVVLGLVVIADWAYAAGHRFETLWKRSVVLVAGVSLPIAVTVIHRASLGTLAGFIERAVLGILHLPGLYLLPLPGLEFWALRPDELGTTAFAYFPVSLVHQSWQGELNFYSRPTVLVIEHVVKAIYYVPLVVLVAGSIALVRGWLRGIPRAEWSSLALILAFAAMGYASMLYRPDWIHLMNVYPALLLACVVVLERSARQARRMNWACLLLLVAWLGAGAFTSFSIFSTYRDPVDTPRGQILLPTLEAREVRLVVEDIESQPVEARILVFPAQPVFYFLADRRIPVAFEQIMPGVLLEGDDQRLADALKGIDRFVYNPHVFPTVPIPVTAYAPQMAAVLARDFRVEGVVSESAIALVPRREPARRDEVVTDLWPSLDAPGVAPGQIPGRPPLRQENAVWLMYRVLAAPVTRGRSCFDLRHRVGSGEALSVIPVFHPQLWTEQGSGAERALFSILVTDGTRPPRRIFAQELSARVPGPPLRLALDRFDGREVELHLCTARPPGARTGGKSLPVGWAEPKIVRALLTP